MNSIVLVLEDDIGRDIFLFFFALVCFGVAIMLFVNGRRSVTTTVRGSSHDCSCSDGYDAQKED